MDEKKKPKMRMDVRRVLMFQALETRYSYNRPSNGPNYLRERAALRLRTLCVFFCSPSFSIAFFRPSEKWRAGPKWDGPHLFFSGSPELISASFLLILHTDHMRMETMVLLLRLGQRDAYPLHCQLDTDNISVDFDGLREMIIILSAVKGEHTKPCSFEFFV